MPPHIRFTRRRTCNVTNFVTLFSFTTCDVTFTPILNCRKRAERRQMVTVPTLLRYAIRWMKKTECHKTDMPCHFDIFWSGCEFKQEDDVLRDKRGRVTKSGR